MTGRLPSLLQTTAGYSNAFLQDLVCQHGPRSHWTSEVAYRHSGAVSAFTHEAEIVMRNHVVQERGMGRPGILVSQPAVSMSWIEG